MSNSDNPKNNADVFRTLAHPSAFVPISMSFLALGLVLLHIVLHGTGREPDEGAIAHLWQLLMGLQLPVIGFFVLRWLPKSPRASFVVIALQVGAGFAAAAPVVLLGL